jgi:hypothetical protein
MSDSDNEKASSLQDEKRAQYSHDDLDKSNTNDTKDDVHIHNELAFKGDDSDGHVEWTARTLIAACSLGCLYTGMGFTQL